MRAMKYRAYTYCLTTANDGEIITIGSRDKYYFSPSRRDDNGELYIFRFMDGRKTQVDSNAYEIKCTSVASCGSSVTNVVLQTGDVMLGVASYQTAAAGGSGCTATLYTLRPVFKRNTGTVKNPTNNRSC